MLAGDLIFGDILGPGTNEPLVEVPADIRIDEIEQESDPRDQRITNNTFETAEQLNLGFGATEFDAIDIRGELIPPSSVATAMSSERPRPNQQPPFVPFDDGSILLANQVNFGSGLPIRIDGVIGDSPDGFNAGAGFGGDGDFYEFEEVEAGETIFNHLATNSSLALVLYNEFGEVLQTSDVIRPFGGFDSDTFISYTVDTAGDYYVAVVPYVGSNAAFQTPVNPFDNATVQGGPGGDYILTVGVDAVDVDYYAVDLEPGDILGLNGIGSANLLTVYTPDGNLSARSGQEFGFIYPDKSPLPSGGTSSLAYVATNSGTHYIGLEGFNWSRYVLEARLFRPAIESAPEGQRQVLFLDFDGAELNPAVFDSSLELRTISPMKDFIGAWGLRSTSDLIDRIIKVVDKDLNGDLQKINPNAGVTILNSRDHADPYGDPYVSRVIVGGTVQQLTITTIGVAESIDVGNFDMEETGIVLLDFLASGINNPNSLNIFPLAPGANKADLVAQGIGTIVSHEAGHFFGAFHTERDNNVPSIMDSGGALDQTVGVGNDQVWGTSDDVDVAFVSDDFSHEEGFVGTEELGKAFANVLVAGLGDDAIGGGGKDFSGLVFDDANGNGFQDPGEGGLAGTRVYVDVNNDGEFGIAEPNALTNASGNFNIPDVVAFGDLMIRAATSPGQQVTNPQDGGYPIDTDEPLVFAIQSLTGNAGGIDFNDGPTSYGVASHAIQSGIMLGATNDGETGPIENDGASDDGVTLSSMRAGQSGTATVSATANGFSPAVVNGWIDFNRDGSYEESERIVADQLLEGSTTYTFAVPASASLGTTWARFRFGYERGIGPASEGGVGEVEDYPVQILDMDGGGTGEAPDAIDDVLSVQQDSANSTLSVLSNDDQGSEASSITSVNGAGGTVGIATDGQSLIYTPAPGFFGTDTFTYTLTNSFGSDTATVTVDVIQDNNGGPGNGGDPLIRFRLETTDLSGAPISVIDSGADFLLNAYTDDLRDDGAGVYAAWMDITFDALLASPDGDVTFSDEYPAGRVPKDGVVGNVDGEFDEYGGFAGFATELGAEERLLFTVPMTAGADGILTFESNPADIIPRHEVLILDIEDPIPPELIEYGSTTLTIGAGSGEIFTNPNNRFDVNNDSFVTARDALALINSINADGARSLVGSSVPISDGFFYDVNGDLNLSAIDVLQVINFINAEAAAEPPAAVAAAAVDAVFDVDEDDDDEDDLFAV